MVSRLEIMQKESEKNNQQATSFLTRFISIIAVGGTIGFILLMAVGLRLLKI